MTTKSFLGLYVALGAALIISLAACGSDGICDGGDCECPPGEVCDFDCEDGDCNQQCATNSDCTASCVGGGCNQQCSLDASCDFSCAGGNCNQSCLGSTDCSFSCSGGGCQNDSPF